MTFENIFIKHPTSIIFIACLLFFAICIILCAPKVKSKPLIAYEDAVYKEFIMQKLKRTTVGKMTNLINQTKFNDSSLCYQAWHLFKYDLRDDHTLASLLYRREGTNFSTKQRTACFLLYILTLAAASALYYGQTQTGIVGMCMCVFLCVCVVCDVCAVCAVCGCLVYVCVGVGVGG